MIHQKRCETIITTSYRTVNCPFSEVWKWSHYRSVTLLSLYLLINLTYRHEYLVNRLTAAWREDLLPNVCFMVMDDMCFLESSFNKKSHDSIILYCLFVSLFVFLFVWNEMENSILFFNVHKIINYNKIITRYGRYDKTRNDLLWLLSRFSKCAWRIN